MVGTVVGGVDDGGVDDGGVDDGGDGASDAAACGAGAGVASGAGAGSGAGGGGSLCTAAVLAAVVGGVVMAGAAGGAVVGTGFASDCPGVSVSFITAVTDPKPTRNAATHATGTTTARPPILEEKERAPSSSVAGSIDSRWASSSRRGAPFVSRSAAGSVSAPSASRCAAGSVALSSGTPLTLPCVFATIEPFATDPLNNGRWHENADPLRSVATRNENAPRSSSHATRVHLSERNTRHHSSRADPPPAANLPPKIPLLFVRGMGRGWQR